MSQKNPVKETTHYYVTLFKLKDHKTWHAHMARTANGFVNQTTGMNHQIITDKKVYKIDRMTGELSLNQQ